MLESPQRVMLVGQDRAAARSALQRFAPALQWAEADELSEASLTGRYDAAIVVSPIDEAALRKLDCPALVIGSQELAKLPSVLTLPVGTPESQIYESFRFVLELAEARSALKAQATAMGLTRRRHDMALEVTQVGSWT